MSGIQVVVIAASIESMTRVLMGLPWTPAAKRGLAVSAIGTYVLSHSLTRDSQSAARQRNPDRLQFHDTLPHHPVARLE